MRWMIVLLVLLMQCMLPAFAEEGAVLQETVLFDGEAAVSGPWQLATGVNTTSSNGRFDASLISKDGYFVIEYTGTANAVYLAFSEWSSGTWASVNAPDRCESKEGLHTATFSFEQCCAQYGSEDFSAVDQICVGATNATGETVIRRIAWYGKPLVDDLGADAVLFRGAATANAPNSNLAFVYTKHVGGEFDAAQINVGSRFYVEYSGTRNGVYLALSSHFGATQWSRIDPGETIELENGRYAAYFDYDDFARKWGTNFARLDQVNVFTNTSGEVTLHRIAYFAGEGAPVDTSDGHWNRPERGIAFIGDSICQNPIYSHGDWNTILGRTDCVNYGIGGQTTLECRGRIDELASCDYDIVVFICGINDIGRGHSNEEIVANINAMVSAIREKNPDCQFLLISVLPTTDVFYTGQQHKITQLNAAYKGYAEKTPGVAYADVYSSFTSKTGEYAYPELLTDGLHPNREGYAVMAGIISDFLPDVN